MGVGAVVGALVGDLVGALVGPLVGPLVAPLVDPLVGRGSLSPALRVAQQGANYRTCSDSIRNVRASPINFGTACGH